MASDDGHDAEVMEAACAKVEGKLDAALVAFAPRDVGSHMVNEVRIPDQERPLKNFHFALCEDMYVLMSNKADGEAPSM